MAIEYLPVNWDFYHSSALKLAETLLSNKTTIHEIVAISRGGLTFGHVLSDFLRIPIWTIAIQSYTDIQVQGEIKITGKLQNSIEGKSVLLVDDVADSGKTLVRAIDYLQDAGANDITTMTMFYKPHSVFKPDYFAEQTSKWILFPYEPTEMILLISQSLHKDKKDSAFIQAFLKNLGYTDEQISFAKTWHSKKI